MSSKKPERLKIELLITCEQGWAFSNSNFSDKNPSSNKAVEDTSKVSSGM